MRDYLVTIEKGILVSAENPLAALRQAMTDDDSIEDATAVTIEDVTEEE